MNKDGKCEEEGGKCREEKCEIWGDCGYCD